MIHFKCPNCGGIYLRVDVVCSAYLKQNDDPADDPADGFPYLEVDKGAPYFDECSHTVCRTCEEEGGLFKFSVEQQDFRRQEKLLKAAGKPVDYDSFKESMSWLTRFVDTYKGPG